MDVTRSDRKSGSGDSTYVVDKDIVDRGGATCACQAVLDVLRARLTQIWIDAYVDNRDGYLPR